jgi:transposase-like protein
MKNTPLRRQTITIAQRGQIIQRVIVDGWSSAEVAASFNVPKRLVEVWVADFRRNGMASLRRDPGRTVAAEVVQLTLCRPIRATMRKILTGLRRFFTIEPLVQPSPLRRSNEDGPR